MDEACVTACMWGRRVRMDGCRDELVMNNGSDFDFIIIGSGAGGGTLAYHLAPSGKRILLIERGPFVKARKGELELPRGERPRAL